MNDSMALQPANQSGALAPSSPDRLAEWRTQLQKDIKTKKITAATAATYERGMERFGKWCRARHADGTLPDRKIVRAWIDELSSARHPTRVDDDGNPAPLYSPNSITAWLIGVRAFFGWLLENEFIAADPTAGIKVSGRAERAEGHTRESLTLEEVARLRGLASLSKRDKALIVLMLYTGARGVEFIRSNIEDLRTVNGETALYIQGKGKRYKKEFLAIVQPDAQVVLRDYLAELAQAGHTTGPLFATEREFKGQRRRISSRTLRLIVRTALDKAGISQRHTKSTHSLRHTAIQRVVDLTNDVRAGQRLARHKRQETTEIYAKNRKRMDDAPERLISYD